MKVLALARFVFGALDRRRAKNGALIASLACVSALFYAALFVTTSLRHELLAGLEGAPDLTIQRLVAGRPTLVPRALSSALAALPGVRTAAPRVWGYVFAEAVDANVTIIGMRESQPPPASALAEGRLPAGPREALVGSALANLLGVRPGDELALPAPAGPHVLEVVGTFDAESAWRTADVVYVDETDARALLGVPAEDAVDIALSLTTVDEAGVLAKKITRLDPTLRVIDRRAIERTGVLAIDARSGLFAAASLPALVAFALIAFAGAALGSDELKEVAVLKTIGWSTRDVLRARVAESAMVGFLGSTLGLVGAYVYVFALRAPGVAELLLGLGALAPPFALVPALGPAELIAVVALVVAPFVAVSVAPAARAALLDPDRILRGLA